MRNRLHCGLHATRIAAVLLGVVAAGALMPASTVAPAGAAAATRAEIADDSGLYVVILPLIDSRSSLPVEVYEIDKVDGIYIRLVWSTIEPSPGAYDWSTLDHELDRALRAGKKVPLSVITGGYTPDWPAGRGVSRSTFVVGTDGTREGCRTIQISWPWDPEYQNANVAVMNALAQHLRARPGAYEAVRIVKITGIGQLSEELRLPSSDGRPRRSGGRPKACDVSNAVRIWQAAGYRPGLVVEGWTRMATGVAEAFPDKLLAQEVVGGNDFPPIGEDGQVRSRPTAKDQIIPTVKDQILRSGLTHFPGRFAVQWNGLRARLRIGAGRCCPHSTGHLCGYNGCSWLHFQGLSAVPSTA